MRHPVPLVFNICIKLIFFYLALQETERAVLKLPPNSEDDKEPDDAQEVKNNLPVLADDQIKEYMHVRSEVIERDFRIISWVRVR